MKTRNDWIEHWKGEKYSSSRMKSYRTIIGAYKGTPHRILDIGCGLSFESEYLQREHPGVELYLMDGEFKKKANPRQIGFGSAKNFQYYNTIKELKDSFDSRGMIYNFVDANNIDLKESLKFDIIYSNLSCGFHYPATTYKDLVQRHSDENTVVIFDIRKGSKQKGFKILKELYRGNKNTKCVIKFI